MLNSSLRCSKPIGKKQRMPGEEPKRRTRKCAVKSCRKSFEPRSMTHKTCSVECSISFVADEKARKDRSERRAGLAKLKRRGDWMKEAQTAFNAYVRARDAAAGITKCICCGVDFSDPKLGGAIDAGHYRSVGSAPHMRFIELNCHSQSKRCNRFGAGRAVDYRIGLIARIGLAAVEALEADQTPRKYSVDDLIEIKAHYVSKLKRLKNND